MSEAVSERETGSPQPSVPLKNKGAADKKLREAKKSAAVKIAAVVDEMVSHLDLDAESFIQAYDALPTLHADSQKLLGRYPRTKLTKECATFAHMLVGLLGTSDSCFVGELQLCDHSSSSSGATDSSSSESGSESAEGEEDAEEEQEEEERPRKITRK